MHARACWRCRHDARSHVLAARTREWSLRVRASHPLCTRGPRRQVEAVRPRSEDGVGDRVHRFLALLGLGMLTLHGTALVLDSTVHIALAALFMPFASAYRPAAVAAGVVAAELMALVTLSFSLRKWIGGRTWRRLHWSAYLIFVLGTMHGLTAGTDTWAYPLYLG